MNRRGFLAALLGAAAAPIVAQIADKFTGPEMPPPHKTVWVQGPGVEWTIIDLRAMALAALCEWFDRRFDDLLYVQLLTGVADG